MFERKQRLHFLLFVMQQAEDSVRGAGAIVGQGSRSLEKGNCNDHDAIISSEFKLKGYFHKRMLPNILAYRSKS